MTIPEGKELDAAHELISRTALFRRSAVLRLEKLAGDASGRRYCRLHLSDAQPSTVILMLLAGTVGPVAQGGSRDQDHAFVALAPFLRAHSLRVPQILVDGRDRQALLVEDFGDLALHYFTFNRLPPEALPLKERLGGADAVVTLYKKALNALALLQSIPVDAACPVAGRTMEYEQYRLEAQRFVDHYLAPSGASRALIVLAEQGLDRLCRALAAHPRCLMYRDFMPWNIQVLPDGELGFLDFQDMLVGSVAYDFVSLIHDRDADFALGEERSGLLLQYFMEQRGFGEEFVRWYHEVLLQRHFRLAGQFRLLTQKTGRPIYESWVPGCLRRVGRSLAALPESAELLDALAAEIPDIAQGAKSFWVAA